MPRKLVTVAVALALAGSSPAGAKEPAKAAPALATDCSVGRSEVPLPASELKLTTSGPFDLVFQETDVKDVYRALGKMAGIDVLLDEQVRDKKVSVELRGRSFQEIRDHLLLVNQHYAKVLDERTLIVIPDNQTKRRQYDELAIRTFFLCWADINEVQQLVQRLINTRFMSTGKQTRSITIRDTVEKISIAGRLIEMVDKPPGEVVLELDVARGSRHTPVELRLTDGERGHIEIPDPSATQAGAMISVSARVQTLRTAEVSMDVSVSLTVPSAEDAGKPRVSAKLEMGSCIRDGEAAVLGRLGDLVLTVTPRLLRLPAVTSADVAPTYVGTEENTTFRRP